jgi:hydrogenase maturation factor
MKLSTEIILAVTLVMICGILSTVIYKYQEKTLLTKNIELAVGKGVDPVAIRCAFAGSSDAICIAYAMKK